MARKRGRLGEILHKAGLVERWDLVNAINTSMRSDKRLGEILVERGQVDEETLTKCIAVQFGLGYVDSDETSISPDTLKLIPEEIVKEECIIPIGMSERSLKLIVSDPTDHEMMDALRFCLNTELECYLAGPTKIRAYLNQAFSPVEISGQSASAPVDAHDCPEFALQGTETFEHRAPNCQGAQIEGEVEAQSQEQAIAKKRHMGHFFTKVSALKKLRRVVARTTMSHFKKCKSCWIKNRIPTDYSDHYFSCERCGSSIQVRPSVLALILWSVILLTALAVAIWGTALTPSLLSKDFSEPDADTNVVAIALQHFQQSFGYQGKRHTRIKSPLLFLSIGTKNSPAAGGAGTMYFDDI